MSRRGIAWLSTIVTLIPFALASNSSPCCSQNAGFDPELAADLAKTLSSHSWEYGTAAEALLELYNPELSVFHREAFPKALLPVVPVIEDVPALVYIKPHIRLDNTTLIDGDGASGDPASLGVFALLIGQTDKTYLDAATRQLVHFFLTPQWPNGALSHRDNNAELWADFMYMAPPFIAYYGPAFSTDEPLRFALKQCLLYRQALRPNTSSEAVSAGAWQHILGVENQDLGLWSTGNRWAAMGMARVVATLLRWQPTNTGVNPQLAQKDLFSWIGEILQGAMSSPKDDGLLRNYLNDTTWFGETSGTALLKATVYRVAVMQEEASSLFADGLEKPVTTETLAWADENMKAIASHVDENGLASPAVNPLGWGDRTPFTKGSPEGQSFLVILYAAWRDCIEASVCVKSPIRYIV